MLGNRLNSISAGCHICVWDQYSFDCGGGGGRELNFHVKSIIGYK